MGGEVLIWLDLFVQLFIEALAALAAIAVAGAVAVGAVRLVEGRRPRGGPR